jgi:hypothetical protein
MVLRIASLLIALAAVPGRAEGERLCFSREESRERIHAERLAEPFNVVRSTAGAMHADALGAKLCRTDGNFVYEINLLDPNGRVVHATVDAATGRPRPLPR